jgi:hypothetical protein
MNELLTDLHLHLMVSVVSASEPVLYDYCVVHF